MLGVFFMVLVALANKKMSPLFQKRTHLYYEYDRNKVVLPQGKTGHEIAKENIKELVSDISLSLKLYPQEEQALLSELQNASLDIQSSTIRISFVTQEDLTRLLPLSFSISPTNLSRIQFVVSPAKNSSISAPQLRSIRRDGFSVVEIGAYSAQ